MHLLSAKGIWAMRIIWTLIALGIVIALGRALPLGATTITPVSAGQTQTGEIRQADTGLGPELFILQAAP